MPLFEMHGGKDLADDTKIIPGAEKPPDTDGSNFQGCREGSFKTVGGWVGCALQCSTCGARPPLFKMFQGILSGPSTGFSST